MLTLIAAKESAAPISSHPAGDIPDSLFPKGHEEETVGEAQAFLKHRIKSGVTCPCCGQLVKDYKFSVLATMSATLMWVVGQARRKKETWVHLNNPEAPAWIKADRNYPRLAYWNLMLPKEQPDKEIKRCSGFWCPTERGVDFTFDRVKVPKYIIAYNNIPFEFSEELTSVKETLGERFNYQELLNTWVL